MNFAHFEPIFGGEAGQYRDMSRKVAGSPLLKLGLSWGRAVGGNDGRRGGTVTSSRSVAGELLN